MARGAFYLAKNSRSFKMGANGINNGNVLGKFLENLRIVEFPKCELFN